MAHRREVERPTWGATKELVLDESLLRPMEELVETIELREAGDPDSPAWEAASRVQHLEQELASRLRSGPRLAGGGDAGVAEEALVAIG